MPFESIVRFTHLKHPSRGRNLSSGRLEAAKSGFIASWDSTDQVKVRLPVRATLMHGGGEMRMQQHTVTVIEKGGFTLQGRLLFLLAQKSPCVAKVADVLRMGGFDYASISRAIRRLIATGVLEKRGGTICSLSLKPWMLGLPDVFRGLDAPTQQRVLARRTIANMRARLGRELYQIVRFRLSDGRSLVFGATLHLPLSAAQLVNQFILLD